VPHKADGEDAVAFFDADTGVELRSPAPLKIRVDSFAFHPTKGLLAIGTGGRLGLINLSTGKTMWGTPQVHKVSINGLAFSPSGRQLRPTAGRSMARATASSCSMPPREHRSTTSGATKQGLASAVVFSGDGQRLAAFVGDQDKPDYDLECGLKRADSPHYGCCSRR
jgi:WD40 repeat protein